MDSFMFIVHFYSKMSVSESMNLSRIIKLIERSIEVWKKIVLLSSP